MARTKQVASKVRRRVYDNAVIDYAETLLTSKGEELSDVVIKTKERDFKLHKIFLGRSSFFNALFGKWRPKEDDATTQVISMETVEEAIPDLTSEIWADLFYVLYVGEPKHEFGMYQPQKALKLIQLIRYFDLPVTMHLLKKMSPLVRLYILFEFNMLADVDKCLYEDEETKEMRECNTFGDPATSTAIMLTTISDMRYSFDTYSLPYLSKEFDSLPPAFVTELVNLTVLPFDVKMHFLYAFIQSKLSIDSVTDMTWRLKEQADEVISVVDSVNLQVLQPHSLGAKYNLFTTEKMDTTREWRESANALKTFSPHTAYISEYLGADDRTTTQTIFNNNFVEITCETDNRSSAWWWDLRVTRSEDVKATIVIYPEFAIAKNSREHYWRKYTAVSSTQELTTIYGEQLDRGGLTLHMFVTISPNTTTA